MDLTPLYELRDRLKAGAIAGTALLGEDFRLARALEALAPLEGASPVFQKIGQGVRALLAADCPDRAAALLDALSLCDAVRTTQGAVGVGGTVEPMPLTARGSALTNAPYSVLQPLTEALTSSGGGRYSFIVDTHDQRPALFQDYRVKHALVAALGGSYSELADRAEEWLSAAGPELVPLLKAGFDPMGRREMVRRIHVMEAVAGAAENDFYRALLEGTCEKEVRAAAVYALRHDEGNAETLVALCKTEKGLAKKAAHWALARMSSPTAWAYWDALAEKKPEQVADYMVLSTAPKAGALIGAALSSCIAPFASGAALTKESAERLQHLLAALPGKSGPEVLGFYRRAADLDTALEQALEGEKNAVTFSVGAGAYHGGQSLTFRNALPALLLRSLLLHPAPELCTLSEDLARTHGGLWSSAAVVGALLTRSAAEAFEAARPLLEPSARLFGRKKEEHRQAELLHQVLDALSWDGAERRHTLCIWVWDPMNEQNFQVRRPLAAALDPRWFPALCARGTGFDDNLIRLMNPGDSTQVPILQKHFYGAALTVSENQKYIAPLKALGWKNFKGFLARYGKDQKRLDFWRVRQYVEELPLTNLEKAAELESILRDAEAGRTGFRGGQGVQALSALIAELKAAPQA